MPPAFRRGQRLLTSRAGELVASTFARLAGVSKPQIRWRITRGPWFHNMLSALEFDGPGARIRLARSTPGTDGTPRLELVCETELTGQGR
jgi:hypothetical protein